jgi:hypothetical protein
VRVSLDVVALAPEPAALAEFLALPARIYADDPRWIPPFTAVVARELCGAPLYEGHVWQSFVARRGDEVVARATAIVNPELKDSSGQGVGAIGYFEAEDDAEAAGAILDTARAWLSQRGRGDEVWGPLNHSIWHDYRFMTRGFERDVFFGEPYNPSYYPRLWTDYGFEPLAPWFSWDLHELHLRGMLQASQALKSGALEEGGCYRLHPFDRGEHFQRDLRRVYDILMPAFKQNLGGTGFPWEAFKEGYAGMRAFLSLPEVSPLLEGPGGEIVGFGFLFPDPSDAFRSLRGDATRAAELPALLAANPPKKLVFHTMAILEHARQKGLVEACLDRVFPKVLAAGINGGYGALAKQGPTVYDKTGKSTREYVLFHHKA